MQADFLDYLQAFVVNIRVGALSLLFGMLAGFILTLTMRKVPIVAKPISIIVGLLRAFPIYILLFIILNLLVSSSLLQGLNPHVRLEIILILTIMGYSTPACTDLIGSFLEHKQKGEVEQSWLIVPNLFGVFIVTLICSSIGASIGLSEAITYTLNYTATLNNRGEIILVTFLSTLFFVLTLLTLKFLMQRGFTLLMHFKAKL